MYPIGQAYFQGKHILTILQVEPCTSPPTRISETDQTVLREAIEAHETGLHVIKAHPIYWANLAALYWLDRQPDAAQTALKQAIDLSDLNDPKIAFYLLNSGCYYELQGQPEPAIAAYGRLLARTPDLITSPFWQASEFRAVHLPAIVDNATHQPLTAPEQLALAIKLESARGNIEAADALVDKLATTFPNDVTSLKLQAQRLLRQQKYSESEDLARQLADDQLLGEIALVMRDTTAARNHLEKAVFLSQDDTEAYFGLAQVALAEGNSAEAIAYLKRITPPFTPPTTSDARFIYGYPPDFSIYPSLLLIAPPPLQGQPFRLLADLYRESGQTDLAKEVDKALASYDPYPKN
jgi:tetratricopeptide (TPR) repeat protein